jgi:hypothetical protein
MAVSTPPPGEYLRYWRFFWPLAFGAICLLAGQQVYNGVLARVGDAERELAVYACAVGIFFLFDIGTAFMPNMVTVYARSRAARVRVHRFCVAVGLAFTLPVLALGASAPGTALVRAMYSLDEAMLADVSAYLVMLAPLILLHVFHHYYNGLLILAERTAAVSAIGVAAVGISIAVALWGLAAGWRPVAIIAAAEWCAGIFRLAAQGLAWARVRHALEGGDAPVPGWDELYGFFWPVCISGMTFGISRPLVFVFVARVPGAIGIIAAMRVAMDFLMLYQSVVNQFRHFFATFGTDDLAAKRRFMALVAGGMTAAMGAVLAWPAASRAFFMGAIGLDEALYADARAMCVLLLVVPSILMIRNYYHGILIVRRQTGAMASGSLLRVLAIAGTSWLLLATGTLGAHTAVIGMIAGFAAEMGVAWWAVRRLAG